MERSSTKKHFERILGLINGEKLVYGGQSEPESLRIAPTVLNNITWDDAVMGEEIFGPLLPILTFDTLDEALDTVESHPHPLALYFFSEDKAAQKKVLDTCRFGGGCINDTIIHLATSDMPFGGVGESGMGSYHAGLVLKPSAITAVLSIRKRGWICRSGIRNIPD